MRDMPTKAIITAGASGIGLVVARALINAGGQVSICDVNQAALATAKATLDLTHAEHCDVTDGDAMAAFVQSAVKAMGGVDTVVANAGIGGPTALLENVRPEDWRSTISVNLDGQFNLLCPVIPFLKLQKNGSIILMSSVAGQLGYPMRAPYAVAKWGVIGLKETLAMELGPYNIRVNAILPGSVQGDRMEQVIADKVAATDMTHEAVFEAEVANVSMRRMVEAEEIAGLVQFLSSPAGRSISGQSIGLCGNYETLG